MPMPYHTRLGSYNLTEKQIKTMTKRGILTINEDGDYEKLCSKCNDWFPVAPDFWYSLWCAIPKRYRLQAHCRACECERQMNKRQKVKDPDISEQEKINNRIEETKNIINAVF